MKFEEAIKLCLRNDIKVYPVNVKQGWMIEVEQNKKTKRINKIIKNNEIDQAMKKTYIYYAKKINK